jgi:hypothetical protein
MHAVALYRSEINGIKISFAYAKVHGCPYLINCGILCMHACMCTSSEGHLYIDQLIIY